MLIQNADRTTYGINKIVVSVLAFVVFFVVGFVSWQWDGVAPEPWRLRTLVLAPLTMSLLLYICCDQFGVYFRCMTLRESIRRFVVAYVCFVVLSVMIWKFFVPFSADVGVQFLAYLLTFLGSLWLRVSRFRAEKKLVEEAPTLVVGTPDHVKEFRRMLERNHVDFRKELLESFREQLGDVRYRRARHVIGENARVNAFANALARGDWDEAGVAMRGSHASLRDDYEVSCAEVDTLVSLCDRIPSASSIYGARMTGGGFGGCIVALVKTEDVEKVAQELLDGYCQETGIETTYLVTRAGEGARVLYQA